MSFESLKDEIRANLRSDTAQASRLVASYARRAARDGDPVRKAEASFYRAEVDLVRGRLRQAATGYAGARTVFARRKLGKQRLAAELGALQVNALLGRGPAVRRRPPSESTSRRRTA